MLTTTISFPVDKPMVEAKEGLLSILPAMLSSLVTVWHAWNTHDIQTTRWKIATQVPLPIGSNKVYINLVTYSTDLLHLFNKGPRFQNLRKLVCTKILIQIEHLRYSGEANFYTSSAYNLDFIANSYQSLFARGSFGPRGGYFYYYCSIY